MHNFRVLALPFLLAIPLQAGIIWVESGATGNLPATAQNVSGGVGTPVDAILGTLSTLTEVDMYRIYISDPASFSAMTVDTGFSVGDPQLFLFNAAGFGVYSNDDGSINAPQSFLEPGLPGPQLPGTYFLAIGWWDNEPFSASGPVFVNTSGTNGPDLIGGGGLNPVTGWDNNVSGRPDLPTEYFIELTGVTATPEPATYSLVGIFLTVCGIAARARRTSRPTDA
jgi:hypothetical protein